MRDGSFQNQTDRHKRKGGGERNKEKGEPQLREEEKETAIIEA